MNTRSLGLLTIPVALLMLSCGNAVSPPAEGAISISIIDSNTATTGNRCPGSAMVLLGGEAPSVSSQGTTWIDGQDGHTVSCSVKGSGSYDFSGEIAGNQARFSISGTVERGGTGTASVYVFEPTLRIGMKDTTNCTVEATGDYKVEKGAIWVGVDCTKLVAPLDDRNAWCRLVGTVVFKTCDD